MAIAIAINVIAIVTSLAVHISERDRFYAILALIGAVCLGINIGGLL